MGNLTEYAATRKWLKKTIEDAVAAVAPGLPVYESFAPPSLGGQYVIWDCPEGTDDHAGKARIMTDFSVSVKVVSPGVANLPYDVDAVNAAVDGALQGADYTGYGVHIRAQSGGAFSYPESTDGFVRFEHAGGRYTLHVSNTKAEGSN